MTHGTATGYVYGCRCPSCTRAQRERMREYRARRRNNESVRPYCYKSLVTKTIGPGDAPTSRDLAPGR